jgi:hypothetical protein
LAYFIIEASFWSIGGTRGICRKAFISIIAAGTSRKGSALATGD